MTTRYIAWNGELKVTLLIFSGRKNPQWIISRKQAEAILDMVQKNTQALPENMQSLSRGFGYAGFLVEPVNKQDGGPGHFIVGKGMLAFASGESFAVTDPDIEEALLESALSVDLSDGLRSKALEAIRKREKTAASIPQVAPPHGDDAIWNAASVIRGNNCYNYACNSITNSFAQPGIAGGFDIEAANPVDLAAVRQGAQTDGLVPFEGGYPSGDPGTGHYVALGFEPGDDWDFHWWRLDDDTNWSHKPGETKVLHVGDDTLPITAAHNPSDLVVRGPYTEFGGYFHVPAGIIIS